MKERESWTKELAAFREWWEGLKVEAQERRDRERRTLQRLAERQAKLEGRLTRLENLKIAERLGELRNEVDAIEAELQLGIELDELVEESGIL